MFGAGPLALNAYLEILVAATTPCHVAPYHISPPQPPPLTLWATLSLGFLPWFSHMTHLHWLFPAHHLPSLPLPPLIICLHLVPLHCHPSPHSSSPMCPLCGTYQKVPVTTGPSPSAHVSGLLSATLTTPLSCPASSC